MPVTQRCLSGDDVGDQHVLDPHDLVLEKQLLLLQPPEGEDIGATRFFKRVNRRVKVAVFATQDFKSDAKHFVMAEFCGGVHGCDESVPAFAKGYRKALPLSEGFCANSR